MNRGLITGFAAGAITVASLMMWLPGNPVDTARAAESTPAEWSRTKPYPNHDVYYPGTEALAPDEMRVIACGTGMPTPRLKQAADSASSCH